ncbi:integrase family protein [Devosia submarina]|uniref:integrase family protein n=1 Tax=Devosia submarina TaxID=1173082 RepID=UPI000D35638E|nr:integrase family protein [Devosia submarina]
MPITITNSTLAKAKTDAVPGGSAYEITDARSQGLELRVRPRGAMWCLRYKVAGKSKRLTIGSVDLLSIAEARQVASDAQAVIRSGGFLDEGWMTKRLVDLGKLEAAPVLAPIAWTFEEGRTEYLAETKRTKSIATFNDYRQILQSVDLKHLESRQLQSITRPELAEILKAVHRSGRETHSDHVLRVLRPFWAWLGDDAQVTKSGVTPGLLVGLKAPPRSRVEDDDEDDHGTYVPELEEMASVILNARSGALSPGIAGAVELLVWTVQRRRAIVEARVQDFVPRADGKTGLWSVPPASRKGRKKNGKRKRPLVIPLPEPIWNCVLAAAAARGETDSPWLFPADGEQGHMHVSTLTHYLSYLPGIRATPHDMRRGFGTHGESILGFMRQDTKLLFDHEDEPFSVREVTHRSAAPSAGMTGIHYSLHDGTHRTWPIMEAWAAALQREIDRLLAERPRLFDQEFVAREVARNKRLPKHRRNACVPLIPVAAE